MDELELLMRRNRDFSSSPVLCFTETWLNESIPDCSVQLNGFSLYRADRQRNLSGGKTRGGGVCLYINNAWSTDVTVVSKHCSPDLEYLFINCKPFYSPREFCSFILTAVYIPPSADVHVAERALAEQVTNVERNFPDSLLIIMGDFNKGNLSRELPKYRQFIKVPTREQSTLDHCYTTVSKAFRAVSRAALGFSDHVMVHLIPTYRQRLKLSKPVVRTSKRWTSEAVEELRACLDITEWDVFRAATDSLDEYTDTVTSYIRFCEDSIIPTHTKVTFNNDKPWFTPKLRQLRQQKEAAHRAGDRERYKDAKYGFSKEVSRARSQYNTRLKQQFSDGNPASVWRGLRLITNYSPRAPPAADDRKKAEELNAFYSRFDITPSPTVDTSANPTLITPTSPTTLLIQEQDVDRIFRKSNPRKAAGPDGVSPATLRHCAGELSPVFTDIFNTSLESCRVPACFKSSTIVPVPKKPQIAGLNDYRPVALTSVVMKSFERLVLPHLKSFTSSLLDPLQFAYRANRSVDDAINLALHFILQHLDSPGTYARILFVDFSSAFNTILPALLQDKLSQLNVPDSTCRWITDFLTDRSQCVRLGKNVSDTRTISTGSPQGCVLSPLLFSLYTNCCTSSHDSVKLIKFADDTTLIGLISGGDESVYRREVDRLVSWCSSNNLVFNAQKTVEMIVDFRKTTAPQPPPLTMTGAPITTVDSFRFLGTTITQDLKWEPTISSLIKKAQQRMYFLRQLRKAKLPAQMMVQFYTAIIESILTSSITVWYAGATARDKQRLQRIVRSAEKVIGRSLPSLQDLYVSRALGRAGRITADPSHPGHGLFDPLPSGRRLRSIRTRTSRHKNSFFPSAVGLMNTS